MEFDGKTVLVTGGSSGIGEKCAERFAALGATVVVNSARSVEAGEAVAERIDGIYMQADVSDETAVRAMISAAVERTGRLDVVVNNAGTTEMIPHHDLDAVTDEVWDTIINTNLIGTWYVTRAAVPHLRQSDNGSVINITSLAGVRVLGSSIPYAVSKAGLNHLTRLLAKALGPDVRVNAVAPGLVDTPWTSDWDEVRAHVEATVPARRSATPDDVADACLYLAESTFVTGDILLVDGGHHLL
ncbi:MAG: SDR family oxidoreductase [Acidimicrobiia bacterium]|nr:SDR family oxidoreductase [Acidimicrobiia bacterium]